MIISDKQALERLTSPMNLMNRLASSPKNSAMSLFGVNKNNKNENKNETKEQPKAERSFNPFPIKQNTELATIPPAIPTSIPPASQETKSTPGVEDLIETADVQVRLAQAHDNALDTLNSAVKLMREKLDDIPAKNLPGIITATSKVVESIRRERLELNKQNKGDKQVHYHFYTPAQKKSSDYGEVIEVS